ncbi:MAG: DUF2807 domain-containing protein [Bacteroidetes bacterium]|nr:DUF2807 domain-containing protein [Bacteroidota bacterium]
MKIIGFLFLGLFFFVVLSCRKANERSCFKRSGDPSFRTVVLGSFNRLFLREHIKYVLVQDSTDQVIVRGGANLIPFIEIDEVDGLVTVVNKNRCNFLRNYDIPTVEIHFTRLINLHFEGTEELYNLDTISTDYLTITLRDGAGTIDLTLNAIDIKAENTNGWGSMVLRGSTQSLRANLMGDGAFHFEELKVLNSLKILTVSSREQKIRAEAIPLQVQIDGMGNIRYWGYPSTISLNKYGSGDLIDSN